MSASEPDEATKLAMEACRIEVVEGDGDADNSYTRPGGGGGGEFADPIGMELDAVQDRANEWRERAIAARAAAVIDERWDALAGATAENSLLESQIANYRVNDETPTKEELY